MAKLIALVLRNGISMVVYAALGLWIRQFDVANWGRSEEPLPSTAFAGEKVTDAAAPVAPATVADAPVEAPVRPAEPAAPVAEPEPAAVAAEPAPAAVEPEPVAAPAEPEEPAASEPEYAPDGSEVIGVEPIAKAAPEQNEPAGEGPADEESDAPAQE